MGIPAATGAALLSLTAFPVSYFVNTVSALEDPNSIFVVGVLVLLALSTAAYLQVRNQPPRDPLLYAFTVFAFTSVIDLIISLEEDGFISGFMSFYMKEGEPYLRTAYGVMACYWDGSVHYILYLWLISAIGQGKNYRHTGLYWLGSIMTSMLVLIPGSVIGKFGSLIRPAVLLNIPYIFIPIWAGVKVFRKPKMVPQSTADQITLEQKKPLYQRPLDLVLIAYLLFAIVFSIFRGLVALDCPLESCFNYIYQYEPYLKDPVAYPKVMMLVYMFYCVPLFAVSVLGLIKPGCDWMMDISLVLAGILAQGQFTHIFSSYHSMTPYTYRVPEGTWWTVLMLNLVYGLGPQLLAYRCCYYSDFFVRTAPKTKEENDKKHQ